MRSRRQAATELWREYPGLADLQSIAGVSIVYSTEALLQRPHKPFKIGVCHDPGKRWLGYTNHKGEDVPPLMRDFGQLLVCAVSDNTVAGDVETELISRWKGHKLCLNRTKGREGVSGEEITSPYFVYVAFLK